MKQFLVILVVFFLTSCEQVNAFMDRATDQYLKKNYASTLYYGDFSKVATEYDVGYYLFRTITYKGEKNANFVQSPSVTVSLGTGDCEDFALLYMNILYVNFGIKSDLVFVEHSKMRTVEGGGEFDHCMVRLANGDIIEPQNGLVYIVDVEYSYKFDEIFKR